MTTCPVTTVGRLRAALAAYPSDAPILIGLQPGHPQAVMIGTLAGTPQCQDRDNPDPGTGTGTGAVPDKSGSPSAGSLVWIAQAAPVGYLPAIARDALGGRWRSDTAHG